MQSTWDTPAAVETRDVSKWCRPVHQSYQQQQRHRRLNPSSINEQISNPSERETAHHRRYNGHHKNNTVCMWVCSLLQNSAYGNSKLYLETALRPVTRIRIVVIWSVSNLRTDCDSVRSFISERHLINVKLITDFIAVTHRKQLKLEM